MKLSVAKAKTDGACILSLRRSDHVGCIGEFMEQAASAALVCFALTNTHGSEVLVAPHGGCERRLSANPQGGASPRPKGPPIMMDISTSASAEGKIKVAHSRGDSLSAGLFVNSNGEPSTTPEEYYGSPRGALLRPRSNAVVQGSKLMTGHGRKSARSLPLSVLRSQSSKFSDTILHDRMQISAAFAVLAVGAARQTIKCSAGYN